MQRDLPTRQRAHVPFERIGPAARRIAVVGAGISGMAAALELSRDHAVTLIEAAPRLGGHARTVLAGRRGDQPVDTGFIVFNKVNYPHLTALFERLEVPIALSDMGFAASLKGGALEYATRDLGTMFAQKRNLMRPAFLGMVRDILRFNARAGRDEIDPDLPLGAYLDEMGLGRAFRDWYLGPISGAIWSTPSTDVMDFPARALIRFFENHALLHHTGQHDWFTVEGGSVEYVRRLEAELARVGVAIRTDAPLRGLRRHPFGVELRLAGGEWEDFDEVVLAVHADDALRLISDADDAERRILSDIRFTTNRAVLHCDAAQMPRRRKCWAAWNYVEGSGGPGPQLGLTYWMNRLQPIPQDDPLFVTLNPAAPIREEAIYDETAYAHPLYDLPMAGAVAALRARNGTRRTWFCGAWMRNGFHEDGYASAVEVARAIGTRDAAARAA